ncbi:MAG: alpha/beta fold hydrolase [Candidatus Nanopelagicales bacterium]
MRLWDWSLPPTGAHREVLSIVPEGWHDEPRATRKPPLLFIHGLAHGAWCWREHWMPAAADRGFPTFAVSLRGHGDSGGRKRIGRTLMRHYVHDVMQTIAELPQPPVIVGHSMGALIAQLVADRYQPRALALLTPAPLQGAAGIMVKLARKRPLDAAKVVAGGTLPLRAEDLFPGLDETTAARYIDRLGRESPWAQYELLIPKKIGPVRAPVLVVGTPEDRVVDEAATVQTAAAYGIEPVWIPGIGHDLMLDVGWEKPLSVILDWIDENT